MVFKISTAVKGLLFSDCTTPERKFSMLIADTVRW